MRFTPSPHHDRDSLIAVTGRVPLSLVHDAELTRKARHDAQDDLGEWASRNHDRMKLCTPVATQQQSDAERSRVLRESLMRLRPVPVGCSSACADGDQCDCSHSQAWNGPRQPRLRARATLPRLTPWRRLVLALQRLRACFRWGRR